jgi:hypothetical protein
MMMHAYSGYPPSSSPPPPTTTTGPPSRRVPPRHSPPHQRGLLWRLLGMGQTTTNHNYNNNNMAFRKGTSSFSTDDDNDNEENAEGGRHAPADVAAEPVFTRVLPNEVELTALVEHLNLFDLERRLTLTEHTVLPAAVYNARASSSGGPSSSSTLAPHGSSSATAAGGGSVVHLPADTFGEDDLTLLATLHKLCVQFLGGKMPPGVRIPPYLDAQYAGLSVASDLTGYLKRIVTTPKTHMSSEQRELFGHQIEFPPEVRKQLSSFYPHMMILIQALLVHLCAKGQENHERLTTLQTTVLRIWRDVLGDLDSLRIVLVHAERQHIIELGDAPRLWEEFIKESVDQIHRCQLNIHAADTAAIKLKGQLSERDRALDTIRGRYDAPSFELEMVEGQRSRSLNALTNATSVATVLGSYNANELDRILHLGVPAPPPPPLTNNIPL